MMCALRGGGACAIGIALALTVSGIAAAADRAAALRAISEMMTASRAMSADQERGDSPGVSAGATRVIEAGDRALEALPKPGNRHARDAAEHLREAIETARRAAEASAQGRADDATSHIRRTQRHIRQASGHAEAL
ncbi:MAG: hypothetical protein ACOYXU_00800 [Nitrospirota bacterium]